MNLFLALADILFNTFAPIFLIVTAVVLVNRRVKLDAQIFSRGIIYLFTPALLFNRVATTNMQASEIGSVVLAAVCAGVFMVVLATGIARLLRFDRTLASTFVLTAFVMNSVNFGYPFIEFALGSEALDRAVVFTVGQIFVVYTLGVYVASRGQRSVQDSVKNVFLIPLPYALALGAFFNLTGLTVPLPLDRATAVLGQATVPCALVILGLQLSSVSLTGQVKPLAAATLTRFVGGAAVGLLMVWLFGLQGLTAQVFILESSMPVGVTSGVLATEFGGDPQFAAAAVMVSTVLSVFFLGGLLLLLPV
ncbi:MAG: AEC family transporter [Anaerolineales bacterium]|nr:AEC family transporter [Anaerolineales bacterium]